VRALRFAPLLRPEWPGVMLRQARPEAEEGDFVAPLAGPVPSAAAGAPKTGDGPWVLEVDVEPRFDTWFGDHVQIGRVVCEIARSEPKFGHHADL